MKNRNLIQQKSLIEARSPLFLLMPCYWSGFVFIFCAVGFFSVSSNLFSL